MTTPAITQSTKKSLGDLFRDIESHEFAVELGIASTRELYRELLASHPHVLELIEAMAARRQVGAEILERINSISAIEHDPNYANPYDAALAAYLWCLNSHWVSSPEVARFAANQVLKVNDLWWSRALAIEVLTGERSIRGSKARELAVAFHFNIGSALAEPAKVTYSIPKPEKTEGWVLTDFSNELSRAELNPIVVRSHIKRMARSKSRNIQQSRKHPSKKSSSLRQMAWH